MSDVYSLGASLYEALTGRPPFDSKGTPAEVSRRVLTEPLRPPQELARGVPRSVGHVVCRAMAKDLAARFPTPIEFAHAVTELTSEVGVSE